MKKLDGILATGLVLVSAGVGFSTGFIVGVAKVETYLADRAVSGYIDLKKTLYRVTRVD